MWFRDQAATIEGASWQGGAPWRGSSWRGSSWRGSSWRGSWQNFAGRTRQFAGDESDLRQRIWQKLKREAANIPFVEEALTAHYCAFDRKTPLYVKLALVGAV